MSLRACGTVVEKNRDRVIVRIEQERCANCTGCIRFNLNKDIRAIGNQAIGERVTVRTSATQLSLASLLVFGVPVTSLAFAMLVWESLWITVVALSLSIYVVYICMRVARLRKFFKVYAESI
ncbi:MAG: SoxR reducing system RseC family protein [Gammaproteobacteria bacterium]|nr:SoxR reducing system RseC family protein [Gammaproteobacteria bacterium]